METTGQLQAWLYLCKLAKIFNFCGGAEMRLISVPDHPLPALRPAITVITVISDVDCISQAGLQQSICWCPVLIDRGTMVTTTAPSPSPEEKIGQEDAGFFNQLIKSILEVSSPSLVQG
jgi:hypothetical protein